MRLGHYPTTFFPSAFSTGKPFPRGPSTGMVSPAFICENSSASDPVTEQEESNNTDVGTMVWIPATGEKYHSIPNCGRMNPDTARQVSRSEAEAMGYGPCSKCY